MVEYKVEVMVEYKVEVNGQTTKWFNLDGELHREGGLPAVEWNNGSKEWYIKGERHREDGPAIEDCNGYKRWCINGERHRVDGPAIEFANGTKEWFIDGESYTEEEFIIKTQPKKEMTMEELEKQLGFAVKIIK